MKTNLFLLFVAAVGVSFLQSQIGLGQAVFNLGPGDSIADNTVIPNGSTVNVLGGEIGLGVDLSNGQLNIQDGMVAAGATGIGTGFTNTSNEVNISGGTVGGFFQLDNSTLNLSGGQIESFGLFGDTTVNITGGNVTRFPDIFSGGTVNIRGGDIFAVRVFDGGTVNFFGSEFFLDGTPIDAAFNEERLITDRDVTLTEILEDGSAIETTLSSTAGGFFSPEPDAATSGSRVTITISVPEPASGFILALIGVPLVARRRRT